jgi:hypothetical protein
MRIWYACKYVSTIHALYIQCVQKAWKHPNKIETNDFWEKRKNR